MPHNFQEAKAERDRLEEAVTRASDDLRAFPRNAMGLVPDAEKTPAYHAADARYKAAFAALQRFNTHFVRMFAKNFRAERSARHAQYESAAPSSKRKSSARSKPKRSKKRRKLARVRLVTRRRGWGVLRKPYQTYQVVLRFPDGKEVGAGRAFNLTEAQKIKASLEKAAHAAGERYKYFIR